MKIVFVVQRYGVEVAGGAELHCREFAERLRARGHDVTVLTNCARSYVDWADEYEPGESVINGVTVHRLPIRRTRDAATFEELNARVAWGRSPIPRFLQREWMRASGPEMRGYDEALTALAAGADVVVFFTYLYYTTSRGLELLAGKVPTVLHPTIHDEAPAYRSMFRHMFRLPSVLAISMPEELDLIERLYGIRPRHEVIGVGVELDRAADPSQFRRRQGLDGDPYIAYVGRLDPGKGSDELFDFFTTYQARGTTDLRLVVLGDPIKPLPEHPRVLATGFIPDEMRDSALAGALALAQPSYFESFSMVLTEAFALRTPALVQGHNAVLDGHARRSGGAIPYRGYAEFEVALDLLRDRPRLRADLGDAGRRYVEQNYAWSEVIDRYEGLLTRTAAQARL